LGKAKSGNKNNRTQKKGWNHRCRAKETFPVDESSLGGKTAGWVEKIKQPVRPGALSLPHLFCSRFAAFSQRPAQCTFTEYLRLLGVPNVQD